MSVHALLAPVAGDLLAAELRRLPRLTEFRGLSVYAFVAEECPHVMNEVGRLREKVFRESGAGRGAPIDVDVLDFGETAYQQLVAFDPETQHLVAMIRLQRGSRVKNHGVHILRTSSLFEYSPTFVREILPHGVELGRSLVNSAAPRARLGLFALWRGLAALATGEQPFEYCFGNVTIYKGYSRAARDRLVATVEHLYAPPTPMFVARDGLRLVPGVEASLPDVVFSQAREGVAHVQKVLATLGERMPLILQSYLSLSTQVWCGQTAQDVDFGQAYEMAIIVPLRKMEPRAQQLFGLHPDVESL